ncbi:MAG: HEAT repeat domain-containing protein, partial [Gemmatimonadota bacterium]
RNIQLYPPDSRPIAEALREVRQAVEAILEKNEHLHLSHAQRFLLANGQRLDVSRYSMLAGSFFELLTRCELQGIVFRRGVTPDELRALLMALGKLRPETIDQGFWRNFSLERGLRHIELRQVRYSRLRRKKGRAVARPLVVEEEQLGPAELAEIPKILRTLQGAAQNAKLYPLDSKPVSRSLEQLHAALQGVLRNHQSLSLAATDRSLLVNGAKLDVTGFAPLAASVVELMDSVGLTSITFARNIPPAELLSFVDALREPPASGNEADFWDLLARRQGFQHLAFNQRQYALGVVESLLSSLELEIEEEADEDATAELTEQMLEETTEALRDALPKFGKELLVKGEHKLVRRVLRRLFEDFQEQHPDDREMTILACRALYDGLILGLQHKFSELAVDPLLTTLSTEADARVLQELSALLHNMAGSAVQFADHAIASRALLEVRARQSELEHAGRASESLVRILDRKLDATAQELLKDDLRSGQPDRQERAAQVTGALGRSGIPLLIDVIKDEKNFRVRLMAARLLAELDADAGEQLRRALATEVTVEQRFRILEVIDTVTRDVRDELAHSLGDASPKLRRAAFRLFERLRDDSLIDIILPLVRDDEPTVAKGAIRSLAHLRSATAVDAIVSILEETEEPKVAIACCQALGELGQASAIDTLARVLKQRRHLSFRRRWDEQVRATAALALKQISDPRAAQVLSRYAKDRQTRVRQIAESPGPQDVD